MAVETYTGIHPYMKSGLYLTGGAFFSNSDNTVRLTSADGSGTELDPGDLGFEESKTKPFGSLRWRFTDRWRFEGNYFSIDDSGGFQANEQIDWGDLEFEVGARIKAKTETSITRLALGYSFIKSDRVELGAGVGVHYLDWEVKLSGNATVDGEPVLSASQKGSVNGWAPNLALFGGFAFNERWMLQGRVDWISANIGDIDGRLWRFGGSFDLPTFQARWIRGRLRLPGYRPGRKERRRQDQNRWRPLWSDPVRGHELFLSSRFRQLAGRQA